MGRQIQIVATHGDCWSLVDFVGQTSPVRVFRSFAKKEEELWLRPYEIPEREHAVFYVWPTSFAWTPTFGKTGGPGCPPERTGRSYISNYSTAPVIEITSAVFSEARHGRVYWARNFSATAPLGYDEPRFDDLVTKLFKHVRKVAEKTSDGLVGIWFLPEAWSRKDEFKKVPIQPPQTTPGSSAPLRV